MARGRVVPNGAPFGQFALKVRTGRAACLWSIGSNGMHSGFSSLAGTIKTYRNRFHLIPEGATDRKWVRKGLDFLF
jgi:hypothetical protein